MRGKGISALSPSYRPGDSIGGLTVANRPTENPLHRRGFSVGLPERIRTADLQSRSLTRYPAVPRVEILNLRNGKTNLRPVPSHSRRLSPRLHCVGAVHSALPTPCFGDFASQKRLSTVFARSPSKSESDALSAFPVHLCVASRRLDTLGSSCSQRGTSLRRKQHSVVCVLLSTGRNIKFEKWQDEPSSRPVA